MKLPLPFLFAVLACFGWMISESSTASANHDRSLTDAARRFKDACKDLEIEVMRSRHIARHDVRLVNEYEAQSIALHGAAHNTRDLDRLFRKWHEVSQLHHRVERTLFDPAYYPYDGKLARCWHAVQLAYHGVANELNWYQNGIGPDLGHHDYGFGGRPLVSPPIGAPPAFAPPQITIESYRPPLNYHPRAPFDRGCPSTGLPSSPYRSLYSSPFVRPSSPIAVPPAVPTPSIRYRPTLPPTPPAPSLSPRTPFEVSIPRSRGVEHLSRRTFGGHHGRTVSVGALLSR